MRAKANNAQRRRERVREKEHLGTEENHGERTYEEDRDEGSGKDSREGVEIKNILGQGNSKTNLKKMKEEVKKPF